jgi:hypothetical protein
MAVRLSGLWLACALATMLIPPRAFARVIGKACDDWIDTAIVLVSVAAALGLAVLYGINYRAATRDRRRFIVTSLLLVACPLAFLVPPGFAALVCLDNIKRCTLVEEVKPLDCFLLSESTLLMVVVLWSVIIGLRRRMPGAFRTALAIPGVAFTINHPLVIATNWTAIQNGTDKGLTYLASLIFFVLPGLWAASACFLASHLASRRKARRRDHARM